ncbi:MAG: NINE protein [Spirochaetaceae bacterium]|jgi:TM2 domain-containing membrane protein YozV|nr:NINE protein [Spirochaetaceae bacterium]
MYNLPLAYLLWFFSGFGALGFHRFYLGKFGTGLLWMFTGGLGMIGSVYDFLTLPRQVREANKRFLRQGAANGGETFRMVHDGSDWIVRDKESVERITLRLAKRNRGILTSSELALEAGISIDEAKKNLDALVDRGFAELRVRKSGTLVYTLPELMDEDSPLEDF